VFNFGHEFKERRCLDVIRELIVGMYFTSVFTQPSACWKPKLRRSISSCEVDRLPLPTIFAHFRIGVDRMLTISRIIWRRASK